MSPQRRKEQPVTGDRKSMIALTGLTGIEERTIFSQHPLRRLFVLLPALAPCGRRSSS